MDIRRLEVFCRVVELKSFTRAAEAVLLSQPSVSEHVRILEETVGEKLLDRLGREALPTGAGEILYRYARRIIQLRDEAVQAIGNYRGNLSGAFPFGASTIPGGYILPRIIRTFHEKYADIQVLLKIAGTSAIVKEVLQGTLEVGIVGADPGDLRLECEPLFSDSLLLAVSPTHPWAHRDSVTPMEIEKEPFILREEGSGTRKVMGRVLSEKGVDSSRLRVVAEMGSTEAVRQGVRSGLGVSILSSLALEEDVRRKEVVTVPIEGVHIVRSFYLIRRRNRQPSPVAVSFVGHLRAAVADWVSIPS